MLFSGITIAHLIDYSIVRKHTFLYALIVEMKQLLDCLLLGCLLFILSYLKPNHNISEA